MGVSKQKLYDAVMRDIAELPQECYIMVEAVVKEHLKPKRTVLSQAAIFTIQGVLYMKCTLSGKPFPATTEFFDESPSGRKLPNGLTLDPRSKQAKSTASMFYARRKAEIKKLSDILATTDDSEEALRLTKQIEALRKQRPEY